MGASIGLVLAGDVMTGRGVDQVLAAPGSPELHESHVQDARAYVELAERASGPVPRPVPPQWPWGAAVEAMRHLGPSVRVMNLETSITTSDELAPRKAVRYRMSPANLEVLRVAEVDVWALANNHVLDHGVAGLLETLDTLDAAGLAHAGAGRNQAEAWQLATCPGGDGCAVRVLSVAHGSSGVPAHWAAARHTPGVALLPDLSEDTADTVAARLHGGAAAGDLLVVSVHWGDNWGYAVPPAQRRFAHRLLDAGVHVVHGHSSHHPRPLEVHRGRLVLYGCGDLVNDYEGIRGHEQFRGDLRLLYLARVAVGTGELHSLEMVPLRARRLSLEHAGGRDADWLARTLDRECRELGDASVRLRPDGLLELVRPW